EQVVVAHVLVQDLDGHHAVLRRLVGAIDRAHAALAELLLDPPPSRHGATDVLVARAARARLHEDGPVLGTELDLLLVLYRAGRTGLLHGCGSNAKAAGLSRSPRT